MIRHSVAEHALRGELSQAEHAAREHPRRVTVGRVFYVDLVAAMRGPHFKRYGKSGRETLRTDALLWIAERETLAPAIRAADRAPNRGASVVAYLRAVESVSRLDYAASMPRKSEWLTTDAHGRPILSDYARRTLNTALSVARSRPETVAERKQAERVSPVDPSHTGAGSLAELAEREQREAEPETGAYPEHGATLIARAMGLSENAGRALIYDAHGMTPDDAAEAWGIARASVAARVSEGRSVVRASYPDPRELLDAIRDAAGAVREYLRDDAERVIGDYRDGYASASSATEAASEWRAEVAGMAPERRALTLAALARGAGSDLAERIAASLPRLYSAEQRRMRAHSDKRARGGNVLPGADASADPYPWNGAPLGARKVAA